MFLKVFSILSLASLIASVGTASIGTISRYTNEDVAPLYRDICYIETKVLSDSSLEVQVAVNYKDRTPDCSSNGPLGEPVCGPIKVAAYETFIFNFEYNTMTVLSTQNHAQYPTSSFSLQKIVTPYNANGYYFSLSFNNNTMIEGDHRKVILGDVAFEEQDSNSKILSFEFTQGNIFPNRRGTQHGQLSSCFGLHPVQ